MRVTAPRDTYTGDRNIYCLELRERFHHIASSTAHFILIVEAYVMKQQWLLTSSLGFRIGRGKWVLPLRGRLIAGMH
jgi:hypothetical protein